MSGPFGGPSSGPPTGQGIQPPGYPQPGGYYQQPGGPPVGGQPGGPPPAFGYPYGQRTPGPSRAGARPVAAFVGVLIALAVVAGLIVFLSRPAPPTPPCAPAVPCAPKPSLPAVGSSPGPVATSRVPVPTGAVSSPASGASLPPVSQPGSDSPPVISGQLYTDDALNFGFEYNSNRWDVANSSQGSVVLVGKRYNAQVWVDAKTAETSVQAMIQSELADVDKFMIARVADQDTYDALLDPSVGYVPGDGGVWSGTIVGQDGTPQGPGGVTIDAASDGRITVAVVVIVGAPDATQGGETQQHLVRSAVDDIIKTFEWKLQ